MRTKTKVHAIAGVVGFVTIATFWISTLIIELAGSYVAIAALKNGILWGMIVLVPAIAIAGGSGMSLGQGRNDQGVLTKKKRMPFIASNGLLVLLPSAVFLSMKADAGEIDTVFYVVQSIELLAGAVNLTLMGLNMRDGLRLTGRIGGAAAGTAGKAPTIDLSHDGPVVVSGLNSLIGTEDESMPTKPIMALCRCGASKSKPFCDESHTSVNFADEKLPGRTTDKTQSYEGQDVSVHYNRLLCSKSFECGRRLERVFDTKRDPWIEPDRGSVDEIVSIIRACPSGALSYQVNGTSIRHEVARDSVIEIESNGPYHVRNVSLTSDEWCSGACENKYSLCRCGASKNKPFCDGSHLTAGFVD